MNGRALLIIDMQNGSFTKETPRFNSTEVCQRINAISAKFREQKLAVIFIQHNGSRQNCFHPGTDDWKILPALETKTGDFFVDKTANDCFYRSNLENILQQQRIKELVITGCATDFCVDTTIRSAFSKEFEITVISDAHTTADRPLLKAQQVIEHHNWVWSEMTPINGSIEVVDCNTYLKKMEAEYPSKMIWY